MTVFPVNVCQQAQALRHTLSHVVFSEILNFAPDMLPSSGQIDHICISDPKHPVICQQIATFDEQNIALDHFDLV